MKNITRTMTNFEIKAYTVDEAVTPPEVKVYGECIAQDTAMTKGAARAALADAMGHTVPKGLTITWAPVSSITYAMPLDKFLAEAVVIDTCDL